MTNEPAIDLSGSEGTTVTQVVAAYAKAGFGSSFSVLAGGRLNCLTCRKTSAAAAVTMTSLRRMEGESDPDDMVAVVAVSCPLCGVRGTMVLGFGPAASAEDTDVLHELHDERTDFVPSEAHDDGPPAGPSA